MAEPASHWEAAALPLLQRVVDKGESLRQRGMLEIGAGQSGADWLELDISEGELLETLLKLQDLGYVSFEFMPEGGATVMLLDLRITGRGLQVLGEWPRFEAWASPTTLAAFAERMAQFASPEDRTRLQRAAAYLRSQGSGALKGAAIAAGSELVRNALGLG